MSDWVTLRDALNLKLRPIDDWPGKARTSRDKSPYSAPLKDTLAVLKRELRELSSKNIVIQIAIREQDLRLDGLPRAGAVATHPGVILVFGSKHGPLRVYFDRFTNWAHNLRAIAMHLEHLRLASIYGVGTDGEQYKGWKALPPPMAGMQDARDAALWISRVFVANAEPGNWAQEEILKSRDDMRDAYRNAARKLHPDTGGDAEQFKKLQAAKEILEQYFA